MEFGHSMASPPSPLGLVGLGSWPGLELFGNFKLNTFVHILSMLGTGAGAHQEPFIVRLSSLSIEDENLSGV